LSFIFAALLSAKVNTKETIYSFYEDDGEHAPYSCLEASKIPTKLTKKNKISKSPLYLGSFQRQFSTKNEAGIDAWEHYFKIKMNAILPSQSSIIL